VRERLVLELRRRGAADALIEPEVLDAVEALLRRAADQRESALLVVSEALGSPEEWRLDTALALQSHRGAFAGPVLMFLKRRVLLPAFRWLFEFSRDNFARQQKVNQLLFACVQELAVENVRLRSEIEKLAER